MNTGSSASQRPTKEVEAARAFDAELGLAVDYFPALWHTFNVGHMMATDLAQVCRRFTLSLADFNLMGALRINRPKPLRATDLAITLQVSNAALTSRIDKLVSKGFLIKSPIADDRRAFELELTEAGQDLVDTIHQAIETESEFVRHFRRLSKDDRAALERIMGEMHALLDRDFKHVHR